MRRRMQVLAALVLVVAGCSGDGEDSAATTTTPVDRPTTVVDETAPTPLDPSSTTTPGDTAAPEPLPVEASYAVEVVIDGLEQLVGVVAPDEGRVFVIDQPGRVVAFNGFLYLDITDRVVFEGEQGLLGVAFPPEHAETGRVYVNYTADGDDGLETRVSTFTEGFDGALDPDTEQILLTISQPAGNHNGGMMAFGSDGNLWIASGDGGGSDDQFDQAQDPSTLLGAMLRITPDGQGGYTIPPDNPFVDGGGAPEVWAYGLRNPWRFTFDGDDLWIADVGQGDVEEINLLDASSDGGANLGWPDFEGLECHLSDSCDDTGMTAPVFTYDHSEGCSITGGVVARADSLPALSGHYLFGDYCGGWVRSLLVVDGEVVDDRELIPPGGIPSLSAFGTDAAGEIFITSTNGVVYHLVG